MLMNECKVGYFITLTPNYTALLCYFYLFIYFWTLRVYRHAGEVCTMALDLVQGVRAFEIPHRPGKYGKFRTVY